MPSEEGVAGCGVVARAAVPEQGIVVSQSYELTSVYFQGVSRSSSTVERVPVDVLCKSNLAAANARHLMLIDRSSGYTCLYLLFNHALEELGGELARRAAFFSLGIRGSV